MEKFIKSDEFDQLMGIIHKTIGIAALVLAQCSSPISSGEIIKKTYEPQREYTQLGYRKIGSMRFPNRVTMIDDEDFIITFASGRSERTVYVTRNVYDSLKVGDVFDTSKLAYEDSDPDLRK